MYKELNKNGLPMLINESEANEIVKKHFRIPGIVVYIKDFCRDHDDICFQLEFMRNGDFIDAQPIRLSEDSLSSMENQLISWCDTLEKRFGN